MTKSKQPQPQGERLHEATDLHKAVELHHATRRAIETHQADKRKIFVTALSKHYEVIERLEIIQDQLNESIAEAYQLSGQLETLINETFQELPSTSFN